MAETFFEEKNNLENSYVMQSTDYNCGPAALSTVLNRLGIEANEDEISYLAETDENGTSMYGLIKAANIKGLTLFGVFLSHDELKNNDIVFLAFKETKHFSVVDEITNSKIKLSDPYLGSVMFDKSFFKNIYSGKALISDYENRFYLK